MKKNYKLEDKFIRFLLILIWFILISFGYISIIKPAWLINLSETGKSMEAQQSINKAYEALKNENYKIAVQSYKKALEIQPKMEGAQIGLGVTYSKIGVYNKAISIFKNLLKDKPGNPYALYYNLAEIHEKTGKIEKAVNYYIKSAESAPSAFYPYGKIGQIYLNRKKWDDAIVYYKKAIENKLDIKTSYLSMLKSSLYEYSDPEIIENLNKILASGFPPDFQERYYSERFQKVLSEDKNLANIYNDIGFAYAMKGEMDIAIIYFRKSIKIWPESERAKQDLKTALEIQDENQIKVR
ncbi:MAG: tetratricopeptide repeat protein [Candidatus Tenebribacter burtonii]|jgi:tetratricopeptide (TPR) repeat protein|nr:tetratricopeptide repeat protein [Candidatus Tenebribacter burtonii]